MSPGFPYQSLLIWWVLAICIFFSLSGPKVSYQIYMWDEPIQCVAFFLSLWPQSLLPISTCGMTLYNALLSFSPFGHKVSYQYLHVGWPYTMLCFLSLPLAAKYPTNIYMWDDPIQCFAFFLSLRPQSLLPKSTCGMTLYNALLSFSPFGHKVSYQNLHVGWAYTMLYFLSLPLAAKSPTNIYMWDGPMQCFAFFLSLWPQSLLPISTCGMTLYNALLSFSPFGHKVSYQYLHVGWPYTMLCFLSLPLAAKSPTNIYMWDDPIQCFAFFLSLWPQSLLPKSTCGMTLYNALLSFSPFGHKISYQYLHLGWPYTMRCFLSLSLWPQSLLPISTCGMGLYNALLSFSLYLAAKSPANFYMWDEPMQCVAFFRSLRPQTPHPISWDESVQYFVRIMTAYTFSQITNQTPTLQHSIRHHINIMLLETRNERDDCQRNFVLTRNGWDCAQIARFMGPTWGPPGSCRPQMGPMLSPWTLPSGAFSLSPLPLIPIEITRGMNQYNVLPFFSPPSGHRFPYQYLLVGWVCSGG